jgi:hypothetical protein
LTADRREKDDDVIRSTMLVIGLSLVMVTGSGSSDAPIAAFRQSERDLTPPERFCVDQGGVVRERIPVWGTNLAPDR